MNSELITAFDYFEREKGINRSILIEAVSNAILSAAKKSVGPARELRIDINPKSGEIRALATLIVVERVINEHDEIAISKARVIKPNVEIGESLEVEVTPRSFGRIASQTAKQAMMQRIRQAEKEMIYDEFKDRAGEIVSGVVRRFERSDVILDIGKFEAVMPNKERVQTEEYPSVTGYVLMSWRLKMVRVVQKLLFHAVIRCLLSVSLNLRSAKSRIAPWKSEELPGKPGFAPRSRYPARTKKWIRLVHVSGCEVLGLRTSFVS